MAEETKAPATEVVVAAAEVAPPPSTEEKTTTTTTTTTPVKEETEACVEKSKDGEEAVVAEKPKEGGDESAAVAQSDSFKEESNIVEDLEDPEKKALDELKVLIQQALNNHEFTLPPPPPPAKEEEKPVAAVEEEAKPKPTVEEEEKPTCEVPSKVESESVPEVKASEEAVAPVAAVAEKASEGVVEKTEAVAAPVVVEAVGTGVFVDEDGSKTVEAIEETIVKTDEKSTASASEPAVVEEKTETVVAEEQAAPAEPEEVFIWGIPLLGDERSDVILLKFLRARDFKVKEAFTMIKNTVLWRKEFGIDGLLEEDLGTDLEKVVFMNGFDREGHPVCYNVYGEFMNKELYSKIFCDEEKGQKFLRWRIQFLEKSIQKLDFAPGGICTMVQISDLKNSPGPYKRELRVATNQALSLLQDNYPEFVAKQIFINVPWWYLAFNRMITPFLTQRTRSKFVFAGPSKSAETLFRYIAPEQVPVQYGGLKKEDEHEFTTTDAVTEITIKPSSKQTVEFPVSETCLLVWELRVLDWGVSYGAEFVPEAEDGYTVIVSKTRKLTPTDEPVICTSFKIGEPGKVVLTIDNQTSKKKKLLYRSKTKVSSAE